MSFRCRGPIPSALVKRLSLVVSVIAVAILLIPTIVGFDTSSADLNEELARYRDDGRRYVLRTAGDEQAGSTGPRHYADAESARASLPGLRTVDALSEIDEGDLVLMATPEQLVPVTFLGADGTFVKVVEPGGATTLYRRRAFDLVFTGMVSDQPGRPSP